MELLSPAGGMLQGKSAVISGADAIYLGAKEFSARSGAANFDFDELKVMVDFCHIRNVDVHLTINTLLADSQIKELDQLILYAREIGVDAFIIQDLGVIRRARILAPDVPIHGSTQMTVCNLEGVRIAEQLGLSRIVLSRELSMKEIEEITKRTSLETEIFVHGAICVSYSGQCLLSSMVGGRSGNRGNCAQPCRKLYKSPNGEGYYLSPGDMCLLGHLDEIKKIGVTSLKIEGRMKSPEYVSTVTKMYRKYLDKGGDVSPEDLGILKNAFCRGENFTDGYFTGETGLSMMRPHVSNDNIYKKQDRKMLSEHALVFSEGKEGKKVPLFGHFEGEVGTFPKLTVWDEQGNTVTLFGEKAVEAPLKDPLSADRIEEQLRKVGATPYEWEKLSVKWDDGFIPIREINELRRNTLEVFSKKKIESRKRVPLFSKDEENEVNELPTTFSLEAIVTTEKQAEALLKSNLERIYVPVQIFSKIKETDEKEIIPYLPPVTTTKENEEYKDILKREKIDKLLCTNIGHIYLAKQVGAKPYGNFQLNLYNANALEEAKVLGIEHAILSVELNHAQIKSLYQNRAFPIGSIVYGKLPLMTTKNCLIKTSGDGKCGCDKDVFLRDQNGTSIRLSKSENCKTIVYNSCPIYLADKMNELKKSLDYGVLLFTDEEPAACVKILEEYSGVRPFDIPKNFTRGHFNRGV